jgi:hypothetical protein
VSIVSILKIKNALIHTKMSADIAIYGGVKKIWRGGMLMNIIFAKHDGCEREFIFEVPCGMHPERNDILWVETSKGDTVAVATSDVISGYKMEQIVEKFGAYLPLQVVRTYANKELQTYIENRIYSEVAAFCRDKQVNIHDNFDLPF